MKKYFVSRSYPVGDGEIIHILLVPDIPTKKLANSIAEAFTIVLNLHPDSRDQINVFEQ